MVVFLPFQLPEEFEPTGTLPLPARVEQVVLAPSHHGSLVLRDDLHATLLFNSHQPSLIRGIGDLLWIVSA